MLHQIVCIFEIDKPTYAQALISADEWAYPLHIDEMPEGTVDYHIQAYFEQDSEGRRVLHLPPQGDVMQQRIRHQQEIEDIEEECQRPETD